MKLVAGMGGQLKCPPAILDPITGKWQANPQVETYEGTGIIRRVTATAVCVVPNPSTGQLTASVQTLTVDAEQVLRQALLKIQRDDAVKVMSLEEVGEERKAGNLKGWTVIPLTPPFAMICANFKSQDVREAFQTFQNQSATIRQRACSKAERLACDHNPITRMVWEYGSLTFLYGPEDKDGNTWLTEPPFKAVPVVAWVNHTGQADMEKLLQSLAGTDDVMGIESVVRGQEVIDYEEITPEDELEDDAPRRIEEQPEEAPPVVAKVAEKVIVEEKPAPAAKEAPKETPKPAATDRTATLLAQVKKGLTMLDEAKAKAAFKAVNLPPDDLDRATMETLISLRREINSAMDA
jgi:hypothetical protein